MPDPQQHSYIYTMIYCQLQYDVLFFFLIFCREIEYEHPKRKRRLKGREESPCESNQRESRRYEIAMREEEIETIGGRVTHVTVSAHFYSESFQYPNMAFVTPSSSLPFPSLTSRFLHLHYWIIIHIYPSWNASYYSLLSQLINLFWDG